MRTRPSEPGARIQRDDPFTLVTMQGRAARTPNIPSRKAPQWALAKKLPVFMRPFPARTFAPAVAGEKVPKADEGAHYWCEKAPSPPLRGPSPRCGGERGLD